MTLVCKKVILKHFLLSLCISGPTTAGLLINTWVFGINSFYTLKLVSMKIPSLSTLRLSSLTNSHPGALLRFMAGDPGAWFFMMEDSRIYSSANNMQLTFCSTPSAFRDLCYWISIWEPPIYLSSAYLKCPGNRALYKKHFFALVSWRPLRDFLLRVPKDRSNASAYAMPVLS